MPKPGRGGWVKTKYRDAKDGYCFGSRRPKKNEGANIKIPKDIEF